MNIYYYLFVVLLHTFLHSAVDWSQGFTHVPQTLGHEVSGLLWNPSAGLLSLQFVYVQTTCLQPSQWLPEVRHSQVTQQSFISAGTKSRSLFLSFVFLTSGSTLFFLNWNKAMNWNRADLEMLCGLSNAFSAAMFEAFRVARRFLHCTVVQDVVQDVRHSRAESCLSFCQLEDWCEWGGGDRDPAHWPECTCSQGDHFMKEKRWHLRIRKLSLLGLSGSWGGSLHSHPT